MNESSNYFIANNYNYDTHKENLSELTTDDS